MPRCSRTGEFRRVGTAADLTDGASLAVDIDGRPVAIIRCDGILYAIDNVCPHAGARLAQGRISGNAVICPLHGARFDLRTGRCCTPQICERPVVVHAVRVVDGKVEVALSAEPVSTPQL